MSASANISFISGPLASTYSLFAVFAFFLTFTSELATPPSLIGSVSPADFPLAQPMGYRRAAAIESVATHSLTAARRVNNAEVCPFVICSTKVGARTCTTRALYNIPVKFHGGQFSRVCLLTERHMVFCVLAPLLTVAWTMPTPRPPLACSSGRREFAGRRRICRAGLELSTPTQAKLEEMGCRDWPQTSKRGPFEDECAAGALRYVLEGRGRVRARTGSEPATTDEEQEVVVGSLLEVSEACTLSWLPEAGCEEMVILTPEYKGPPIAFVAAAFVGLCAISLLAVTGQ